MPIITTRAKDYNFPETSAAVLSAVGNKGLDADGASDLFMGPVTLTDIQMQWERTGTVTERNIYVKVYDSLSPFDPGAATGLKEPLWIISLWDGIPALLTFPDGFTFTNGVSLRATLEAGTGTAGGDTDPDGNVDVRLVGRKP